MLYLIISSLVAGFRPRQPPVLENLALRHQVQVLKRGRKRPRIKKQDRALWSLPSRFWRGWRTSILIVQPDTVIRWHRAGFRLYWRFKRQ